MKHTRTRAALRKAHGAFLVIHEHEWAALESLPAWAVRLFLVMLRCTDFHSGLGSTSYPYLVECMKCDQPARGPRLFEPTLQAVKRMVRDFEQLRILARDRRYSNAQQALFFTVADRLGVSASAGKLDPQTRTPVDNAFGGKNTGFKRGSGPSSGETRPPHSTPS